ncbi:Crp/Fnr family transcriptional regulator [Bacillus sp. EB01]|uniref:Crp/Fnr family transcriptional regulator n=1 Tax=Bacillus sp. EB01 TaxID=1347086 RepID=UPI0005C69F17|nr:helix-turn-helix domain-containing protein [Bacillus sp. EB01]
MKEVRDRKLLDHFIKKYQFASIFPESFLEYLTLYSFERGELICSQGQASSNLFVLVEGKFKVYRTSPEGRTLILSFETPVALIGDIEFVQNTNIINTVAAVSTGYLFGANYQVINRYMGNFAPFLKYLLKMITKKFYVEEYSFNFNLMYPVEVRLASYLLSVSFEEPETESAQSINISDIASLIGTSYRHMNRVLTKFCDEGLVERKRGLIKIKNRDGLEAYASRSIYEP